MHDGMFTDIREWQALLPTFMIHDLWASASHRVMLCSFHQAHLHTLLWLSCHFLNTIRKNKKVYKHTLNHCTRHNRSFLNLEKLSTHIHLPDLHRFKVYILRLVFNCHSHCQLFDVGGLTCIYCCACHNLHCPVHCSKDGTDGDKESQTQTDRRYVHMYFKHRYL